MQGMFNFWATDRETQAVEEVARQHLPPDGWEEDKNLPEFGGHVHTVWVKDPSWLEETAQ
jgi:hypothetical protein